ncbi:hypothetical protein ABT354_11145 [Streptomyces sp. NPDC000594]|uniref:hypothetical protein n=1 Tax=Streptomyces sp. NPDC000594 TaxID=3154261 RepID=UPI00332FF145
MSEEITIPALRSLPRRTTYYRLDERPSPGIWAAARAEPVPARDIRGGTEVIGLATQPSPNRRHDPWRLGRVLIRTNHLKFIRIEIGFHSEWLIWEGDPETPIPVYRHH